MFKNLKKQTAQAIGEHVVTYLIVVLVITGMTIYIKRALQGRMYDAKNYMMKTAAKAFYNTYNNSLNFTMNSGYEPYYLYTDATTTRTSDETQQLLGSGTLSSGIFRKTVNQDTSVQSFSNQLPPALAK